MAERRMFAKTIIDSDAFLDMSLATQALYFHLAMRADDDGFLNNAKKIMRIIGAAKRDYDVLLEKRFIIQFEDGICVIKHWRIHNYIQKDRYRETKYVEEKSRLNLKENGAYTLNKMEAVSTLDTECIHDAYGLESQVRLGKDRIGKDSKYICSEPGKSAPNCSDIFLPLLDSTFYNVPLDKIENWKKAFPAVNVIQELMKMLTWLDSNPVKQKTARGINRFINNWLMRTQDSGGGTACKTEAPPVKTKDGRILE